MSQEGRKPVEKVPQRGRGRHKGIEVDFDLDESSALEAYTFADDVVQTLEDIGVGRNERPRIVEDHESILTGLKAGEYFDGRLPTVIRKLSLDQLSALYSLFSNWYGYLMFQARKVATERSEAKTQKELMYAMVRQQKRYDGEGNKRDASSMTNATNSDSRYIRANARYQTLDSLYEGLDAMVKIAAQDMKVISREVTIYQTKLEQDGTRNRIVKRFRSKSFRPEVDHEDEETEDGDTRNRGRWRRSKVRRFSGRR